MIKYFEQTINIISDSLSNLDSVSFFKLVDEVEDTLNSGKKVIVSGLGKNVPICDKFVGTMLSMGLNANFLHTNTAVHGDMGMVKTGDLVIILTKSGATEESVYLAKLLMERKGVNLWLLTFTEASKIEKMIGSDKCLKIKMKHEGDPWNIVPNNSTTLNLIVLQAIAMEMANRMQLSLEDDFKPNHPGGAIGDKLR